MTRSSKAFRMGTVYGAAAIGLGVLIGSLNDKESPETELEPPVVQERLIIDDRNIGRVKLTDMDGDGDWDYLGIHSRKYPGEALGHYFERDPDKFYIKPGFLSRGTETEFQIVDGGAFNDFIKRQGVPMPGDPLLNEEKDIDGRVYQVLGSYAGLFNPEFETREE